MPTTDELERRIEEVAVQHEHEQPRDTGQRDEIVDHEPEELASQVLRPGGRSGRRFRRMRHGVWNFLRPLLFHQLFHRCCAALRSVPGLSGL